MARENEKELQKWKNRLCELAERSYSQGIFTFTGFLGLSEQDVYHREEQGLRYAGCMCFGGYEGADRVMVRFGDVGELGYEVPFPIVCIHIRPLMPKFAQPLSHRDFLGALMNLGIERSTIGDIRVGENQAYLYCLDTIAEFICENLVQIRHTHVKCSICDGIIQLPEEEPKHLEIRVASMRADAVIAGIYKISREKSLDLFRMRKVYLNGRLCENPSCILKKLDTVNARGFGKFTLTGKPRETRKGRLSLEADLYR